MSRADWGNVPIRNSPSKQFRKKRLSFNNTIKHHCLFLVLYLICRKRKNQLCFFKIVTHVFLPFYNRPRVP